MSKKANPTTFKTIQTIYAAFILGVLMLSTVIYFLIDAPFYKLDFNDTFTIIVPAIAVSGAFMSSFLYKTMLQKIHTSDSLSSKLTKYQSATLLKAALLEGPALLASVIAMQTNNLAFFIVTAALVVLMYFNFPSKNKFVNEVALSQEEKSQLDNH